jgi:hypothetical protein
MLRDAFFLRQDALDLPPQLNAEVLAPRLANAVLQRE